MEHRVGSTRRRVIGAQVGQQRLQCDWPALPTLVAALATTIAQSGTESSPAEQAVWRAFAPPHAATPRALPRLNLVIPKLILLVILVIITASFLSNIVCVELRAVTSRIPEHQQPQ